MKIFELWPLAALTLGLATVGLSWVTGLDVPTAALVLLWEKPR